MRQIQVRTQYRPPASSLVAAPGIPPGRTAQACRVGSWLIWLLFAVDFAIRLLLAERRLRYTAKHWLDIVIIALPLLRPLRLLRLVTLLKVLDRSATTGLRGRVALYVAGGATLMAFCGALACLDAERGRPGANITGFGDAMWWAVTTMSTVGYGDRYPTTAAGRLAGVALMIGGIALLSVLTGTFAWWVVDRVRVAEQEQTADLLGEIRRLHDRLDEIQGIRNKGEELPRPRGGGSPP